MGQEFFINSANLEQKIRELFPSQGGSGAGFDLSASTQIIPVVDLTESAEGSNLRQDLQTSLSFDRVEEFAVVNTSTDIITNTGFWRVFGSTKLTAVGGTGTVQTEFDLTDGVTDKRIVFYSLNKDASINTTQTYLFDFIVQVKAGEALKATSNSGDAVIGGCTRQIASIDGILTNPFS